MTDLSQAVALVTGGAQGIGRSFVEHLLFSGAKVAIGDLTSSVGAKTQQELASKYPGKIIFVPCDVTKPVEFEDAIKSTIKTFGVLTVIINNAGICNEADGCWQAVIRINVDGLVTGTKLGFKYMGKNNGGSGGTVVNVASISSFTPWYPVPVYCATKAFINQFSRSYGQPVHYESSGVKVMSINPGVTYTPMLSSGRDSVLENTKESLDGFLNDFPVQAVDNVGKGLIAVLTKGENGSMWVIQNDEPAKQLAFEYTIGFELHS